MLIVSGMYIICKHNEDDNVFYTTASHVFTNTKMIGAATPQVSFPIYLISVSVQPDVM
jgi:hypothetical protein